MKVSVMRFPEKLFNLVNECTTGALQWSEAGNTILVEYKKLKKDILNVKDNFKSEKIDSFIRQLNLYGFRKCNRYGEEVNEYKHPSFLRGRRDLIDQVKRRPGYKSKSRRRRNNSHLASRSSSGSTTPAAESQVNTPPSQSQNANEIMNYWMNQYYLQCPGFSPGMMYPQRNLSQEYYNYFNGINMPQDLEAYAAKKGFVSPSDATNLNRKDTSSSCAGNESKTSAIHEQKTGISHERKTGVTREQNICVAHDQKTGVTHEQKTSVTHEQKTSVTHEQKTSVTHEQKTSVTHEQKTGVTHEQKTGVTHEQKTSVTHYWKPLVSLDKKTGLTYERMTGVTPEQRKTILFASPPKRSISVKVGNSAFVNTTIPNAVRNEEIILKENEPILKKRDNSSLQQQDSTSVDKTPGSVNNGKPAVHESDVSSGKQVKGATERVSKKNSATMTWNDYFMCSSPNFCYVIVPTPNAGLYRGLYPGSQMPFLYPMSPAGMFPSNHPGSAGSYPGYLG